MKEERTKEEESERSASKIKIIWKMWIWGKVPKGEGGEKGTEKESVVCKSLKTHKNSWAFV